MHNATEAMLWEGAFAAMMLKPEYSRYVWELTLCDVQGVLFLLSILSVW